MYGRSRQVDLAFIFETHTHRRHPNVSCRQVGVNGCIDFFWPSSELDRVRAGFLHVNGPVGLSLFAFQILISGSWAMTSSFSITASMFRAWWNPW